MLPYLPIHPRGQKGGAASAGGRQGDGKRTDGWTDSGQTGKDRGQTGKPASAGDRQGDRQGPDMWTDRGQI